MMHLNLFHRTEAGERWEVFRRQQKLVHEMGFRTTIFAQAPELTDDQAVAAVKADAAEHGDEIGLGLHRMMAPGLEKLVHGNNSFWLFSRPRKREVLSEILGRYRAAFGGDPVSVACYHLDASSIEILRELSPGTRVVVGGCFEEGVRVYHGCNNSWYLFNEGMPWGPWYPSKTHSLRPARDTTDAAGVLAVPHLCRDMSLAYEDRDDFWASHPPNVMRGLGNLGSFCPYDRNLIDQYRMQERFNDGHSYYNSFVGAGWLVYNKNIEVPPVVAWDLYRKFLEYFVELREQGQVENPTLGEYAAWHAEHRPLGKAPPETYWAKEMLYGSGKHYVWFADASQRLLIDASQSGSIGDLRPWIGQVPIATGPDTPQREIGSYPYLIHSQHRTGYSTHHRDGSRTTLYVSHGGQTIDLATRWSKCRALERDGTSVRITLLPTSIQFADGLEVEIETRFVIEPAGRTLIERKLVKSSDPAATVEIKEWFKGCHGQTEYAEDLHDVELAIVGKDEQRLKFEYEGRTLTMDAARCVRADVPALRTSVELSPASATPLCGQVEEGYLFNPYFVLALSYRLGLNQSVGTWMTLKKTK